MGKENLNKVLEQLIWNPRRSDREIADAIGVSQPTVSRAVKRIKRKKLVTFIGVPDFHKIGYELVAFNFIKKTEANLDALDKVIASDNESIVFGAESTAELVVISMHQNFTEYSTWVFQFELSRESIICTTGEIVAGFDFSGLKILKDLE